MGKTINIQPLSRIEGHANIKIELNDQGEVEKATTHFNSIRGFEKYVQGKPAEEVTRIVTRICGICPWHHHLASTKAVDACFQAEVPRAGHILRECMQNMAHINDKILHFYFLAAPDFVLGPDADYKVRNVIGIAQAAPDLARKVIQMRQLGQMMMERFAGKVIHPIAAVPGGFSKPMSDSQRLSLVEDTQKLLEFAKFSMAHAKENIFPNYLTEVTTLGSITTGFIGTVDRDGSLNFYDGKIRLMKPDGTCEDFDDADYLDYIGEHVEETSYGKFPYAKSWNEGFSTDLAQPRGIYRSNCLARLNVCDHISTPLAQAELEEFRKSFGRPAQHTLLYHWARLIELVYACEKTLELLLDKAICGKETRLGFTPGAGRGVGHVEAPRGTLIHDYTTDEKGLIKSANMIVGTTHNLAPISMSVEQAARMLIHEGKVDETILNKVEMAVRAYDP
ncbi:Ni/Fe hydrogenase subunit alpha [Desulfospira joergensenii]|uniref:Ni/Fe hydrogenase subunit alpha n=1 Tax=Desulfospira joergensenii TaxID=53329 RepID=UPI0003B32AE5|nr:Ni/Fe hydrogenase subunit alpha [Desulfospira joergensenii]